MGVSCVSDTTSQKEDVVECFVPYDDHKWVNIGKERDQMTPDAVQYARALRPPYHLLSFLRIKGHSTKECPARTRTRWCLSCWRGRSRSSYTPLSSTPRRVTASTFPPRTTTT